MVAIRFSIKCLNRGCHYFFDLNKPHDKEAQSYDAEFEVSVNHYEGDQPVYNKPARCKHCNSANIRATEMINWDKQGSNSRINFGVDYYALLGNSFQRGVKTPKIQFFRRIKEIDREYREIETQRVRKEVGDYLEKIGTPPHQLRSKVAEMEAEICANRHDKFFDERVTIAFLKLQMASDINEIFHPNKEAEKKKYDRGYCGAAGRATCYRHRELVGQGVFRSTLPINFTIFSFFAPKAVWMILSVVVILGKID